MAMLFIYNPCKYFPIIDENVPNYAFSFDKNGVCLFHPDAELMGKNVFQTTNLAASDTAFATNKDFSKIVTLSDYLKLDVVHYIQRLGIKGSDWYISINFPKEIAANNVASLKNMPFGFILSSH